MNANEYQRLAMRTNDGKANVRLKDAVTTYEVGSLINACIGLAGETGEFLDMVKKWIFHEKPLDEEHLKKECGDVLWYVAMICESMNWKMSDIMQMNVDKLLARYPQGEGFSVERANNRAEGDV